MSVLHAGKSIPAYARKSELFLTNVRFVTFSRDEMLSTPKWTRKSPHSSRALKNSFLFLNCTSRFLPLGGQSFSSTSTHLTKKGGRAHASAKTSRSSPRNHAAQTYEHPHRRRLRLLDQTIHPLPSQKKSPNDGSRGNPFISLSSCQG